MSNIDWNAFDSKYTKLTDGWKTLVLTGWTQATKTNQAGVLTPVLNFTVIQEDGVQCSSPKTLEVSTRDLIMKLRPFVEKAEASKKAFITVKICRVTTGKYGVEEVPL